MHIAHDDLNYGSGNSKNASFSSARLIEMNNILFMVYISLQRLSFDEPSQKSRLGSQNHLRESRFALSRLKISAELFAAAGALFPSWATRHRKRIKKIHALCMPGGWK